MSDARKTIQLLVALVSLLFVSSSLGGQLVTEEAIRVQVLNRLFPQARVSVSHGKPLDWRPNSWPGHELTDALAGESEYEVVSAPDAFEESWATDDASDDLDTERGHDRRVRFRVYEVTGNDPASKQYVALAHYQFVGIQAHPFSCEWFARLFVLSHRGEEWTVHETDHSLIYRAKTIRSFRLVDLGDGREKVLVEAENTATGYRRWITMSVFGIADHRLAKLA
jgi:hypothetical protein